MKAWEINGEKMKHSFTITDRQVTKSSYKPPDANETYDDWKNKYSSIFVHVHVYLLYYEGTYQSNQDQEPDYRERIRPVRRLVLSL